MGAGSLQLPAACAVWGAARGTTGVVVPPPGAGAARARSGTTSPGGPRARNGPRGTGRGGPVGAALGGQGGTGESPAGSAGPAGERRGWGTSAAPPQSAPGPAPVRQARVRSPSAAPRPRPRPAGCCGRSSGSQIRPGRSKKSRGRRLWHCPGRAGWMRGLPCVGVCHCCLSHPQKHPLPCAYTPAADTGDFPVGDRVTHGTG